MRVLLVVALAVASLPLAAADNHTSQGIPSPEAPGEQESLETGPGISWGSFILVGMVAFGAALAWASHRYARDRKRPPSP